MNLIKKGILWATSLTPLFIIFLLVTIMTLSNDTARQNLKKSGKQNTFNLQVSLVNTTLKNKVKEKE